MADIDVDTTYGGGRSTTTSRGRGLSMSGGGGSDMGGLGELLRRRFQQRQQERAGPPPEIRGAPDVTGFQMDAVRSRMAPAPMQAPMRAEVDPHQARMQDLEYEDALMRRQAVQSGPPIKYVGGPGMIAGPTMDVMRMNPLQRQLFLPQTSQMGPEMLPPPGLSRQAAGPQAPQRAIEQDEDPLQNYFRHFGNPQALGLAQARR